MVQFWIVGLTKYKILAREIQFKASRSSGPGGQKVNKTSSKMELRWSPFSTQSFSTSQRERLARKLAARIHASGELRITSDTYRTQHQNKEACIRKLESLIQNALRKQRKRKKTKPTQASKEKRLRDKKKRSDKKKERRIRY